MDTRDTRRELAASYGLVVREERWLSAGLLAGAAGYLIWLAGTGVAVARSADVVAAALGTDPGSLELAAVLALWLLLPAVVATRFVVDNVTNLRGNVEQHYRVERPVVLLVPPLSLVAAVLLAALVRGAVGPAVLVALGVANVFLLVRTVAYGYRVYALSAPRFLQGTVLAAALVVSLAVARRGAAMTGQAAFVAGLTDRYGLGGAVSLGPVSADLLSVLGATLPGALALAFVCLQLLASLVVRVREPDVPRSAIRAGQRYPQAVRPASARGPASEAGPATGTGTATASTPADGENTAETPAPGGTEPPDSAGTQADGATGGAEDAPDRFGQTKVYTPPEEGSDAAEAAGTVKNELCPICGATYAADADREHCPNCNARLD